MNVKLAKLFIEKGYLSLDNLKEAVEEQKNNNKSLGEILIRKGYITESQLVELTNIDNQFPRVDLSAINIEPSVIKLIPQDTAVDNNLIPFDLEGAFLSVAMIDPTNIVLIDELRFLTGHNIKPYIAEFSSIKSALVNHHNIDAEQVVQKQEPEPLQKAEQEQTIVQKPEEQQIVQPSEPEPEVAAQAPSEPAQPEPEPQIETQPQSYPEPPVSQSQQTDHSVFTASPQVSSEKTETADTLASSLTTEPESQAQPPQIDEPQFPGQSPQPQPQATDEKPNQNEIIDVFAKDDDDYVRGVKQSSDSSFENISLQSSDSSSNLFQPPAESREVDEPPHTEQTESEPASTAGGEQSLFQAPAEQAGATVGFQPVESQKSEPINIPVPPQAQDSSPELNVFSSSQSASEEDDDKTIELSLEAEEITDQIEVPDNKDVFTIPTMQTESAGTETDLAPDAADSQPGATAPTQSADPGKEVEDLFQIPGQKESEIGNVVPPVNNETDLRSLNEDSSYDNIESFNKTIDSNGNHLGTTVSAEPPKPELREVEPDIPPPPPPVNEPVIPVQDQYAQPADTVSKPTILVVDDSPTVQKIVSVTLSRHGYQVEVSSNAMQALAKLNEFIPDIIFLDINLPHMDGYQLCKIIKGNELTKEVPVIMLSGKDGIIDKMRGKLVGATDYITKPFEPNSLVSAIKKQGVSVAGTA